MTGNWQYKVVKSQRGMDGKWFNYPAAATFVTLPEAGRYAQQFADSQRAAGVTGTRINIHSRRKYDNGFGMTTLVNHFRVEE